MPYRYVYFKNRSQQMDKFFDTEMYKAENKTVFW